MLEKGLTDDNKKKKRLLKYGLSIIAILAIFGFTINEAFADYVSRGSLVGTQGTVGSNGQISGGDTFIVDQSATSNSNQPDTNLNSMGPGDLFMYGADGITISSTGSFGGIWHFDHYKHNGQTISQNNGYLYVLDAYAQQWTNDLGGNWNFVSQNLYQAYFQDISSDAKGQDTSKLDNISRIVSESGAKFEANANNYNYKVDPSNPPSATSLNVTDANTGSSTVKSGDPISIKASSSIPLFSGLAAYHYDAFQFKNNSTGQVTWAKFSGAGSSINVTDSGQTINGMVPESGGNGSQSDSLTDSSDGSLTAGSYTATFWVADGVHRLSSTPATANFTIGAGSGPSVTLTANPIQLPTGQTSTLTANATGMTSQYDIRIIDQSGDNTLSGQNSYQDGRTGETSLSTSAKDNIAQSVTFVAEIVNASTGQIASTSSPVTVTWGNAGGGATISLTANPTSLQTGDKSTISYSVTGWSNGDYVTVTGTGGSSMWSDPHDGNANASHDETENPQNGATTTVKYTAILYNSQGVAQNASSVTITWSSTARPATTSLDLSADPTTLQVGASTTFTIVIPPDSDGGAAPSGEFVQVMNEQTGQYVGMGVYTGGGNITYGFTDSGETESFTTTYSSNTQGPQIFVAKLWGPGVTPWNNPPQLTSNSVTVTWVQPTVTLSANPTNPSSGQASQISYSTVGFSTGDTVTVTGSGGSNMWNAPNDTQASDSYTETENPANGNSTTVQYMSTLKDSTGKILSTSTLTVIWTPPTISMGANPQNMVPGQPSTISYSAKNMAPGDYVNVVSTGGANGWNVANQTQVTEAYQETEYPAAGQTILVNYTATVFDSTGKQLAQATTSAQWISTWNGNITLSANPQYLPEGNTTTITATTSQAVPSGYTLYIKDISTGQVILTSGASPASQQYTCYNAESDQFEAYLNDGYEQVGSVSNIAIVTWSGLMLTANPTQLSINNASTLKVTGQNIPNGDYLAIDDQTTGQVVGFTQSSGPYIITQTKSVAETDVYIAYVNSSPTVTGAYATSNTVTIVWYAVTLVANPTHLPINDTSTLTATAQNVPVGYTLLIVDQTTGKVIAQGSPGQTVLQVTQSMPKAETDTYVAEVAVPPMGGLIAGVFEIGPNVTETFSFNQGSFSPEWVTANSQNGYLGNQYAYSPITGDLYLSSEYGLMYTPNTTTPWSLIVGLGWLGNPLYNPATRDIWVLTTATSNSVDIIGQGNSMIGTLSLPVSVSDLIYDPTRNVIWGSNDSSTLYELNPTTGALIQTFVVGQGQTPWQIAIDNQGVIWFNNGVNSQSAGNFNPSTMQTTILPTPPVGIATIVYDPSTDTIFAANYTWSAENDSMMQFVNGSWKTYMAPNGDGIYALGEYGGAQESLPSQVQATSTPVSVTWYNPIVPPDNPTLTALPTNVVKPAPTQFLVNFDASDADFVNKELGGSAPVQIYNAFTWRPVATGAWSPSSGLSLTLPYNPVPGGSSQYLAFLEDNKKHPLAVSNQVTVTDTGNGKLGNSYSELVCGPNGDGTEIFQNYQNGKLVGSRTVPLTLANLNINGIFNPTQQLKDEYPGMTIKLPVTNAELSNGPIPLRVQAPFGFAVQFPNAQPTQVTATFTVNEGYAVDMQGDTSWTVSMKPAQNQPLYWQGATIMPKLPDGVHIMVKVVAQNDCGTNTLVNNDFVTTAGRPQWYFVQPTKPGN